MENCRDRIYDLLIKYVNRPGVDELLGYMESSGFFKAPASVKYHHSYDAGLSEHSLEMLERLAFHMADDQHYGSLEQCLDSMDKDLAASVVIVGLGHDICKADLYKKGIISVKDPETERWIKVNGWDYNPSTFRLGHGAKSVYILMKYIELTDREAQAIYFHMGAYGEYNGAGVSPELTQVFNNNKLAFYAHISDMESTYAGGAIKL